MKVVSEDRGSLAQHLSDAQMVALAEAFGGTRVYIPNRLAADHPVALAIGIEAGVALVEAIGSGTLHVPIARELRARHYRAAGLSYERIALKLGITRSGVDRMFKRMNPRD